MKRQLLLAAFALALAPAAFAQSTVTVYGIADAAVRHVSHPDTSPTATTGKKNALVAGMSQSRIGFKASEDLGAGSTAFAQFEHRFLLDSGQQVANAPFWQQSLVGLKTPLGQVSFGRQFNVLLDVGATTFPSFRYSPYIEAFKPEMGFAFGVRQDNMVKYAAAVGGLAFELQVSAENGDATTGSAQGVPYSFALPNKSHGAMVRYERNGIASGAGWLEVEDSAGKKARAALLGGSYTRGAWYLNASLSRNQFDPGFGSITAAHPAVAGAVQAQLLSRIVDSGTTGIATPDLDRREMFSLGATYNFTDKFNIGAQVWRIRQVGFTSAGDGRATLVAVVADYALSKRTDVYAEADNSEFDSGAMALSNGAKSRTGFMTGVRHRF